MSFNIALERINDEGEIDILLSHIKKKIKNENNRVDEVSDRKIQVSSRVDGRGILLDIKIISTPSIFFKFYYYTIKIILNPDLSNEERNNYINIIKEAYFKARIKKISDDIMMDSNRLFSQLK